MSIVIVPRITNLRVEWMEQYANRPGFKCDMPQEEFEYAQEHALYEQRGEIFLAICGDYARYFSYDGKPGRGYGGNSFFIQMKDGTTKTLIGPWSSRSGCVNKFFPETLVREVSLYTPEWSTRTAFSAAVTNEAIIREAAKVGMKLGIVTEEGDDESYLEPLHDDWSPKRNYKKMAIQRINPLDFYDECGNKRKGAQE